MLIIYGGHSWMSLKADFIIHFLFLLMKLVFVFLCLSISLGKTQTTASPTYNEIANNLINKLMKLCGETQSISLMDCEPKMIENDKKTGNFRSDYNYTR